MRHRTGFVTAGFSSQTTLFLPERVSRLRLTYSWDVLNHGHLERQLLLESEDDLRRFRIAQVNRSYDDLIGPRR